MEWYHTLTIILTIIPACGYLITRMDKHLSEQAQRSDKLYEMFIDLLREQKTK